MYLPTAQELLCGLDYHFTPPNHLGSHYAACVKLAKKQSDIQAVEKIKGDGKLMLVVVVVTSAKPQSTVRSVPMLYYTVPCEACVILCRRRIAPIAITATTPKKDKRKLLCE